LQIRLLQSLCLTALRQTLQLCARRKVQKLPVGSVRLHQVHWRLHRLPYPKQFAVLSASKIISTGFAVAVVCR
jgi:hypothetical protein